MKTRLHASETPFTYRDSPANHVVATLHLSYTVLVTQEVQPTDSLAT